MYELSCTVYNLAPFDQTVGLLYHISDFPKHNSENEVEGVQISH